MEKVVIDTVDNLEKYTNEKDDILTIREMKAFSYHYPNIMMITPLYNKKECYDKVIEKYKNSKNIKIIREPTLMTIEEKKEVLKRMNSIIDDYIREYKNMRILKVNYVILQNKDMKLEYLGLLRKKLDLIHHVLVYTGPAYIYGITYYFKLKELEDYNVYNNEPKVIISFRNNI